MSPQRRLKDLRAARDLVRRAKSIYGDADYGPLEALLDSDEQSLVRDANAAQEAFSARLARRYDFYSDSASVCLVVRPPSDEDEMPYITAVTYEALKTCLHTDLVRIDAPFDVAVRSGGATIRTINGRNRR